MSRPIKKRNTLLLISSVLLLFVVTSCVDPIPESNFQDKPTIEGHQTELKHYSEDDGHTIWVMNADLVQLFENAQETRAEAVDLTFFDQSGEVALTLTSDGLIFFISTGDLAIKGNIIAEDASGIRLTTEEAYWDEENGVLRGESPVHAEREDFSVSGDGFAYDPNKKTVLISNGKLQAILNGQND